MLYWHFVLLVLVCAQLFSPFISSVCDKGELKRNVWVWTHPVMDEPIRWLSDPADCFTVHGIRTNIRQNSDQIGCCGRRRASCSLKCGWCIWERRRNITRHLWLGVHPGKQWTRSLKHVHLSECTGAAGKVTTWWHHVSYMWAVLLSYSQIEMHFKIKTRSAMITCYVLHFLLTLVALTLTALKEGCNNSLERSWWNECENGGSSYLSRSHYGKVRTDPAGSHVTLEVLGP